MKLLIRISLLLALMAVGEFIAVTPARADISNAAVLFLRIAPGARAAAMGEAYVAVAEDATAVHWNPAGLALPPLAQTLVSDRVPERYRPLRGVAPLRVKGGSSFDSFDLWALTPVGLVRYNYKSWSDGEVFATKSDETVRRIVSTYFNLTNDAEVESAVTAVAERNSRYNLEWIESLRDSILAVVPEDYSRRTELSANLDSLVVLWPECRIDWDRVDETRDRLADGLEDGSLAEVEADRISFAAERARNRFIPEELFVPYGALTTGELTAIASTGPNLVVGTTEGIITYDGRRWQHLTIDDGLPSNNITTLASAPFAVLVGTDAGAVKAFGRSVTGFETRIDMAPTGTIQAIGGDRSDNVFAVADGELYRHNGLDWVTTTEYTVQLDDTPERIAQRFAIYGTESEKQAWLEKFRQLNVQPPDTPDGDPIVPALEEITLTPGQNIFVPMVGELVGEINAIHVSPDRTLYLGTDLGLLVFDGSTWSVPGWRAVPFEGYNTLSEFVSAEAIIGESTELTIDAIRTFNDVVDQPVDSGATLWVPRNPTGLAIRSVGRQTGMTYFATPRGMVVRDRAGSYRLADKAGLGTGDAVEVATVDGEIWWANSDRVVAFAEGNTEFSFMYVNWLPELTDDLYYVHGAIAHPVPGLNGTLAGGIAYINYGEFTRTGETGQTLGTFSSFDIAVTGSFGTSLSNKLKAGISAKVIHSRLADQGAGVERGSGTSWGAAIDLGLLYLASDRLRFGSAITNLGFDMAYIDAEQSDPLPRNLAIGVAYDLVQSEDIRFLATAEANKLLVGLDDGLSQEIEEVIWNFGAEFAYSDFFALRGGYIYDQEGRVKTVAFGAGVGVEFVKLDVSYIPSNDEVALANTFRWSFRFDF